jgi:hypothetical protein
VWCVDSAVHTRGQVSGPLSLLDRKSVGLDFKFEKFENGGRLRNFVTSSPQRGSEFALMENVTLLHPQVCTDFCEVMLNTTRDTDFVGSPCHDTTQTVATRRRVGQE